MSDSMLATWRFAMRPGIELRQDYDAARLRALAKSTRNAGQSRRLLALAKIYDSGTRSKAARVGGVGLQTVRDWVVRFNAHGPEALVDVLQAVIIRLARQVVEGIPQEVHIAALIGGLAQHLADGGPQPG